MVCRYAATVYNYHTTAQQMDIMILMGVAVFPVMVYYHLTYGYTSYELIVGTFGSMLNIVGLVLINYAQAYGLAGPAAAISLLQGVIHVILSAIFMGQSVTTKQYVGSFLLIVGGVVMSIDWEKKS